MDKSSKPTDEKLLTSVRSRDDLGPIRPNEVIRTGSTRMETSPMAARTEAIFNESITLERNKLKDLMKELN